MIWTWSDLLKKKFKDQKIIFLRSGNSAVVSQPIDIEIVT
jgi:hypothetical protein